MPLASVDFDDPNNRKTSKPEHVKLVLRPCGHEKIVSANDTYPVGSFAVCYSCNPPMDRMVGQRMAIGEPKRRAA